MAEDIERWEACFAEERLALQAVSEHESEDRRLGWQVEQGERAESAVSAAQDALGRAEATAQVAREGAAVLRAARRRIAERALKTIEQDANAALRALSDSSFELSWAREGGGKAKSCPACGEPFPASVKVRECPLCGRERGPHMVERLDVVFGGRQSSAIEDLVGTFLAIAAARWLAEDRGSPFSTMFVDEATAHLDAAHRRAVAYKLPGILREMGVTQAFVISHDRGVVAALPSRILIESDGARSVARVV